MKKNIIDIQQKLVPIFQKNNVKRAGLFGSILRSDFTDSSDIDIIVETDEDSSIVDIISLKHEIEHAVGRQVDLVQYQSILPSLKKHILPQEERIYEQS